MKIPLLATLAVVGLTTLAACGHDDNAGSSSTPTGSTPPVASGPPTDFGNVVQALITTQPPFGSNPVVTSALTGDLSLGTAGAFSTTSFGTGDALPAATFQASVACTQAGKTACNPAVSADLNSTLN